MHATPKRSFIKAISYRLLAYIITSITLYIVTGSFLASIGASVIDSIIKLIGYYTHERIWDKISWGRKVNDNLDKCINKCVDN